MVLEPLFYTIILPEHTFVVNSQGEILRIGGPDGGLFVFAAQVGQGAQAERPHAEVA